MINGRVWLLNLMKTLKFGIESFSTKRKNLDAEIGNHGVHSLIREAGEGTHTWEDRPKP